MNCSQVLLLHIFLYTYILKEQRGKRTKEKKRKYNKLKPTTVQCAYQIQFMSLYSYINIRTIDFDVDSSLDIRECN